MAGYSVLASLFMTVPAVLLWEGLKKVSGAFNNTNKEDNNNKDREDDVTMREIYPSGARSVLLLTALPIIGFTGLLWTLLHHPPDSPTLGDCGGVGPPSPLVASTHGDE